ncbi:pleckstrin homology domain-containing family O member 2 isoform X2 [Perognathus longimembris pacificus]|uniref:pleckstrin homology domain-containing family O member 2 isoform X2 n=1 Tax=Perognathus longimembris pacificus TaxID=214514 RepID=UPI002018B6B6|nr:pleckstrin homology domain-containing family O member 2 isoform X2 [Perognathus longimembris pacificus]
MEEEGVKDGGEKPHGARTADKAGWIKKSSGGLLGLWKDRYLLLCQAQLLVYENEDEQKCVETVELGSYERCQDLRALLKRKHRFILLRSPGNKVSDIKFQAPSGEEKESWIKALNEGINRGKNKAFDEVKVDKSYALEHVTRDRVRGGQKRRPPTRVHLKEVANAASEGVLRLDLDVRDSGPPAVAPGQDVSPARPREILRPLMPPSKPSPALERNNRSDGAETPVGERTPTPISASSEALSESQEDSETAAGEDSGPKLPPSNILPEKLMVSWDNSSPEEPPLPPALPPWDSPPQFHPRSSSLGNLLGEGPPHPRLPSLFRAQLEVKVASEETKKLLDKVLSNEPPPASTETLLSEAVEQLRQATQVLQEMKDLGELNQEAPGLREKRKELVTLYRRSAP